jgi:copper homeostasis protein
LDVEGVVFGILTHDGRIDHERNKTLTDLARPMKVTCHRAFDMTRDPFEALEDCISIGFDRILTSGQQPHAINGVDLIEQLIKKSNGRIIIMPGSGVNEESVGEIASKTGAKEIHFSAKQFVPSKNSSPNKLIRFTDPLPAEPGNWIADPATIQRMRRMVEK